jgi:hypothetical protein
VVTVELLAETLIKYIVKFRFKGMFILLGI